MLTRRSNRLSRAIAVMLFAVLLYGVWVVGRGVDLIGRQFEQFSWASLVVACGLSLCNYGLRFLKWDYYLDLLQVRGIPKWRSFLVFLSGFVLTVTPGKLGEVFKSIVLEEWCGVAAERTAPVVIAERLTDLIAVIVLIVVGSATFAGGELWAAIGSALVLMLLAFIGSVRARTFLLRHLALLPGSIGRWFRQMESTVLRFFSRLALLADAPKLLWPTALSLVGWSLEGLGLYILLQGFTAADPSAVLPAPAAAGFFYATSTLAGAIVPVPGGLGVAEGVLEQQLQNWGSLDASTATAAMLLSRLSTLWFGVAVGFLALAVIRLHQRQCPPRPHPLGPSSRPEASPNGDDRPLPLRRIERSSPRIRTNNFSK